MVQGSTFLGGAGALTLCGCCRLTGPVKPGLSVTFHMFENPHIPRDLNTSIITVDSVREGLGELGISGGIEGVIFPFI